MRWVVANAKLFSDHLGHPLARPHFTSKSMDRSSLGYQSFQLFPLFLAHRATFLCSVAPKKGSTERNERFASNCGRRGEPDHRRESATFASLTEGQVETSASRRCEAPEAATGRRASERRAMSTRNGTSRPVSPQRKLAREEVLTCRKRTAPGSIGRRRSTRSASSMRPDGPFPSGNSPTTSGVCANSAAPSRVGASSG